MRRLGLPALLFWFTFFPAWWISATVARSGAPVLEALRDHRSISIVRVGIGGLEAAGDGEAAEWDRRTMDWVTPLAGLVAALLVGRWPAGGQLAACLGFAAAQNPLVWLLFRGLDGNWLRVAGLALAVAVCFAGLRQMLAAVNGPRRWERVLLLAGGFALPVAFIHQSRLPFLIAAFIVTLAAAVMPSGPSRRMTRWHDVAVAAAVALLFGAGLQAARPLPATPIADPIPAPGALFFQRGVNFTAEYPDGYDSRRIAGLLDQLHTFGVDAVALVPYGYSRPGSGVVQFGRGNTMESDDGIAAVALEAHRRGMKVFLKPQLWTGRAFTGDLDYPDAARRTAWFTSYGGFVDHYAALANRIHADLYAVGVEFAKLSRYDEDWRALIARARRSYPGPVTYAANFGAEFESIRFWDALDYIGLNDYYPLPDDLRTADIVAKVEAVQKHFGKPVILAEVGFPSVEGANREPWAEPDRPLSMDAQARCYQALFEAFYQRPWFQGMYWWKVGTNGFGGVEDRSHTPWRKPSMEVVRRWYRDGGR